MGFIEDLRKSIEGRLVVEQQRKTQEAALRAVQEEQRRQQEAGEREFSRRKREQAEVYRVESGIETLLLKFDELIKQDPKIDNYMWRGETGVFQRVQDLPRVVERLDFIGEGEPSSVPDDGFRGGERYAYKALHDAFPSRGEPFYAYDSIFDVAIWWDGEARVARDFSGGGYINRLVHQHIKYFIVETNPEGDIVFHSKIREPISRNIWMNDTNRFENALGKAFNKPKVYTIQEQQWTHGPPPRNG